MLIKTPQIIHNINMFFNNFDDLICDLKFDQTFFNLFIVSWPGSCGMLLCQILSGSGHSPVVMTVLFAAFDLVNYLTD